MASKQNLIGVCLGFFGFSKILTFDNFYAAALREEKLHEIGGKHLPIEYKRYMGREFNKY